MYKLLVTTALVAVTATSASAWTDAKTLIDNLDKVYTNLDGSTANLQATGGELHKFLSDVDAGVTHLVLSVDDDNVITATLNAGVSLDTIQTSADNLVNRVNYDLFVETADTTYDVNGGYAAGKVDLDINPVDNTDPTDYDGTYKAGLLGTKVTALVDGVNEINDQLITTGDNAGRDDFITNWGDGVTGTGTIGTANIADIQGHIANLNIATGVISEAGTGFLNDNIDGTNGIDGLTTGTVNAFKVPGIAANGSVQIAGGDYYANLTAWATGTVSTAP